MIISLPSKNIYIVEVPKVEQFDAKFVYGFFTPDEMVNDTGSVPDYVAAKSAESFENSKIDKIKRFLPRYIRFSWKPNIRGKVNAAAQKISIVDNLSKIHNEQDFTNENYTHMVFQNTKIDDMLTFFIEQSNDIIVNNNNNRSINNTNVRNNISYPVVQSYSVIDFAKSVNKSTTKSIKPKFIIDTIGNSSRFGVGFVNKVTKAPVDTTAISSLKQVKAQVQINNKVLQNLLVSATQDGLGLFKDEADAVMSDAQKIQANSSTTKHSSNFTIEDYELKILDYVSYRKVDINGHEPNNDQIIGYIIEKTEILKDGTEKPYPPIIIQNGSASTAIDVNIKYGSTYSYRIREIAYAELQAEETDSNSVVMAGFLLSSKNSHKISVNCTENVPPPPPADFDIRWDYKKKTAVLTWSFPSNPQRDIKKFQVFRRASIFEPFQLVKVFDFDNSIIKSPYYETPDPSLVEVVENSKGFYVDFDFKKNSNFIYALACIDAHGITSNYSIQYQVSFDKFSNSIIKKVISTAGAPKAYPNSFLSQDVFSNTIRDSGHKRMRVIFSPEYTKATDSTGADLKLIKTNLDNAQYKIQLINLDLQSQQTVNITINDIRPTANKLNVGNK